MLKTFEFIDAQQMAMDHPDTFDVPEPQALAALEVGDFVKVCLAGERFWVLLTGIGHTEDDGLLGTVANGVMVDGLDYGDEVQVHRRHVYQIQIVQE